MKITKLKKEQINKKLLKDFIKLNNSYSPFLGPLDSIDQTVKEVTKYELIYIGINGSRHHKRILCCI